MSNSGKRGTAKGKKFTDAKSATIEFNKDGVAIGPNASSFMSRVGLEFRSRIPYHLLAKDVDKKLYDAAWINNKVKSKKAKISAKQNYEPARVGRRGCIEFLVVWEERWDQLLEREMKANGSYYEVGKNVVTEVVGKRGCSSLVSSIIGSLNSEKKKTKEAERLQEEIDALQ
ncbi:hypothetical protein L1987_65483 [Smallanthus sonchifolius]|uniref:Uncharacterized protein n=1 Tax=Smallanthus sonchifolius TaxID=185202 RepID=A0ACB9BUH3_9ASTR|nr:hypothetical protein L1987_65483 [Smallanthus sonchifolius]